MTSESPPGRTPQEDGIPPPDSPDRPVRDAESAPAGDSHPEAISEEEAIRSLRSRIPERDDWVRSLDVLKSLFRSLGDDPGLHIGSVNVFNDEIRLGQGDFTIGQLRTRPSRKAEAGEAPCLDRAELEASIAGYVAPPGFGRALDILRGRNLLILSAGHGSGRETAALALLAQASPLDQVRLLDDTCLLSEPGWKIGPKGTGFVVAALESAVVGRLDDAWLRQTATRLKNAANFMVVVTGYPTGSLATASARAELVFENLGQPDPVTVVRRRARACLAPDLVEDLEVWLASDEVQALLTDESSPGFLVRIAGAAAEALTARQDPTVAVRQLLEPHARVQAWFARHDSLERAGYQQLVLPIAVAVLEGSSYLTVTDAATALYRRLFPGEQGPPSLRYRRSLREQQQWIRVTVPASPATQYGDPSPELMQFRSPLMRAAVLQYAWSWTDGMRPAMTAWLLDLGQHPDVEVRARAAASAGLLASLDFSYVLHRFLYRWAVDPAPAVRASAAVALAVPGRIPRFADRVWELLRQWAAAESDGPGRGLLWTAAEAAGGILGQSRPGDAVSVLHEVLKRDGWDSLMALALAILNLTESGCVPDVLGALTDWSSPMDGSPPVIKALLAFVITARTPIVRPWGEPAAGKGPWPVLLSRAEGNEQMLCNLWSRSLSVKQVRPLALDALRGWLEIASEDGRAMSLARDLVRGISQLGGKHPDRLQFYLEKWANDPKRPVPSAARLLKTVAMAR